jgi:GAF domain-containing protein
LAHTPDISTINAEHPLVRMAGARAVICVPMLKEDELVGAITIYRQEVRPFTAKQIELVQNFANQAVIAIENVRLLNELRARTDELAQSVEELRALGEVSQAVNSTLDLQTVLDTIVAKATQLSGTEAGTIYVFDEGTHEFQMSANYGMSDDLIAAVKDMHIGISDAVGEASRAGQPHQARPSARWWCAARSRASSPRARSTFCRRSGRSRCWRSRMRGCSPRSARRASSLPSRASTSRSSSPT